MGSRSYVKNAVGVVKALFGEDNLEAELKTIARIPFPSVYKTLNLTYRPNLMMTSVCASSN